MERILITGATGNLGGGVIEHLLRKEVDPKAISALVRNESKADHLRSENVDIRFGDYDDYNSLVRAFDNVYKLLLVSGSEVEKRSKQHENVVKAAMETGVKHLYYTSFERKDESENSPIAVISEAHLKTEQLMKDSGIPYTFFRNNIYMDMIPLFAGDQVTEKGLYFPAGETGVAFALREEMAEAAADILITEGHENKVYDFSNTENISFPEIAEMISEITGKNVPYISPGPEEYIKTVTRAGAPEEIAQMSAAFGEGMRQGEFHTGRTDLDRFLGRKPTSVREFLEDVYGREK